MKRALIAMTALSALLLAGCDLDAGAPPSAKDPRVGRVTITWSNCATGSCAYDWKICIGPDLHMHVAGDDYTVRNSPECKRDQP